MTFEEAVLARGEAEGKAEKIQQTVLNLLREGAEEEFICRILEITPEEVRQVRATMPAKE